MKRKYIVICIDVYSESEVVVSEPLTELMAERRRIKLDREQYMLLYDKRISEVSVIHVVREVQNRDGVVVIVGSPDLNQR